MGAPNPSELLVHWLRPDAVPEESTGHENCRAAVITGIRDPRIGAAELLLINSKATHKQHLIMQLVSVYSDIVVPGTWHRLPEKVENPA